MIFSKKVASYLSLVAITAYWAWSFFNDGKSDIPDDFYDLVLMILAVKVVHFVVTYLLLRSEREGFQQLGFTRHELMKHVLRGLIYGLVVFVIANILLNSIILNSLNPTPAGSGVDMKRYFTNWLNVSIFIFIGIVGGGFVEEFERIFVLTRFQNWLGRPGLYLALIISTLAFGMAHYYQGLNNAITAGFAGLMNGLVYIRRGSAIEAVVCHASFDVIGILVGYFLMRGH